MAAAPVYTLLNEYQEQLRYIFIVSQVAVRQTDDPASPPVTVRVTRAEGEKCERCWNYSTRVGEFERHPTVCERCAAVLAEIEGDAA